MKKENQKEIYVTWERWKKGELDKEFYDLYVQLLVQNEKYEERNSCFKYWEGLKNQERK